MVCQLVQRIADMRMFRNKEGRDGNKVEAAAEALLFKLHQRVPLWSRKSHIKGESLLTRNHGGHELYLSLILLFHHHAHPHSSHSTLHHPPRPPSTSSTLFLCPLPHHPDTSPTFASCHSPRFGWRPFITVLTFHPAASVRTNVCSRRCLPFSRSVAPIRPLPLFTLPSICAFRQLPLCTLSVLPLDSPFTTTLTSTPST